MAVDTQQDNTFKFRMDEATRDLLERARSYVGMDKSKFIRRSIREKAEAVIAEHERTQFSQEDWMLFFDMVEQPAEPTARMKRAKENYKKIFG